MSRCARCGASDAGDEYCLTCGSPLRPESGRARLRDGLAMNPLWTALAVLVLAALGALVAIAASRGGSSESTVVATNLPARTTVRSAPVLGTLTAPPPTIALPTTTAPPPPVAPKSTTLTDWTLPDGYTLVLASVPSANGRATAVQIAKRALAQGLPQVGIIDSKEFAGLHPGYFVVFSGVYSSNAAAAGHLQQARTAGFAASYARRVTR